jgi:thioredoxin-related protein
MDLNELEYKKLSPEKLKKDENDDSLEAERPEVSVDNSNQLPKKWKTILILSITLTLLVGFLLGSVFGLVMGQFIYNICPVEDEPEDSIYSQYDYSSMVIDAEKGVTIQSLYADDEERYYAMQWIGKELPELKWMNSAGETKYIKDLGQERYILEFMEPNCTYCNKMIEVVDSYRATENAYKVIGLSIKDGDLTNFNEKGENTFILINKDAQTKELVKLVAWVPTFVYVENGKVVLVAFGNMNGVEKMQEYIELAFK